MKIVAYSNFDIETVNEWVVADSIKDGILGDIMLKAICDRVHDNDTYYYKLVPDDYALYKWEP